jgi:hypothetical protein
MKIQCASYALEMLSNGGLRTHVLGFLIIKDELSLLYFDRSIFICSESLRFTQNPCEFIAILLILDKLSDEGWGLVPGFSHAANVLPNNGKAARERSKDIFSKQTLKLNNGCTVQFEKILSRHHGLIGRGTCVIRASVTNRPPGWDPTVAVKISSPALNRKSESEILQVIRDKATDAAEHRWVLDHLPKILHHEDLVQNSAQKNLASFLSNDEYERRALRLLIFVELLPITELTTAGELSKVLHGIFRGMSDDILSSLWTYF